MTANTPVLGSLAMLLFLGTTPAVLAQTTVIRHADGTRTYVNTNSRDTQVIHSTRGGAQFGASRTHREVVKEYTRSGDTAKKR